MGDVNILIGAVQITRPRSTEVGGDFRDWSLITGRGGLQNGRGGHVKFYPYEKGGAEKVLAMLKGGHKKFWGSFYSVA